MNQINKTVKPWYANDIEVTIAQLSNSSTQLILIINLLLICWDYIFVNFNTATATTLISLAAFLIYILISLRLRNSISQSVNITNTVNLVIQLTKHNSFLFDFLIIIFQWNSILLLFIICADWNWMKTKNRKRKLCFNAVSLENGNFICELTEFIK